MSPPEPPPPPVSPAVAGAVRMGEDGDGAMMQWRESFLLAILRNAFIFGVIVGIPSIAAAVRDGLWTVVVADVLGLAFAGVLWRARGWPYRVRSWLFAGLVYVLGANFLVVVGPVGQIYLMAFPLMTSLLLGLRASVAALALNAVTLLAVGYLADADLHVPGFENTPLLKWFVITMNVTFVTGLVTIAGAMLLRRLELSLRHQHAVTLSLREERERLEERVRERTARLETANRELESFAYAVSHDLRGPLSSIHGFTHLLESALGPDMDERTLHNLARIKANTLHMGDVIEALLGLAHLSRTSMRWQRTDLSALARARLAAYAEREPGRSVRVVIPDGLFAQGDPALLAVVLDNLLGNAWKFTARQPDARIEFGDGERTDGIRFHFVRDNGAGFDMAHAGRLFGAFQRLHSPGDFPGSGIGLATVQRIVQRHGGQVWATAKVGEGATFCFALRAREASPDALAPGA